MGAVKRKLEADLSHEIALEYFLKFQNGKKIMDEPTEELKYPFDELFDHIEKLQDNLEFFKEGLNGYLISGKSKRLRHEKCVKMYRALNAINSLAKGMIPRFRAIDWPDHKYFWIPSDDPNIYTKTPAWACGEGCDIDLSNKVMK